MKKIFVVGLCLFLSLSLFFAFAESGNIISAGGGGSVFFVDADITENVTWSEGNVYYICRTKDKKAPQITNGARLTIKNGAMVYFSSDTSLIQGTEDKFPYPELRVTNGSIVANGVIFTAVPGREEAGWGKIEAMGSPEGDTGIFFTDCTFKYGGNTRDGLLYGRGHPYSHSMDSEVKISVSGCTFKDPVCKVTNYSPVAICYCNAMGKTETGTVTALNSIFSGFGTAVFVYHKQAEEEIETTVADCTFSDISVRPLLIQGGHKASVTGCVFEDFVPGQHGGPVFIYATLDSHHQNQMVTLTGNSFNYGAATDIYPVEIGARAQINEGLTGSAGNTFGADYPGELRYIVLSGDTGYSPHGIYREAVWGQADIPYLLTKEMIVVGSDENNQSSLTIKPGVTVCLGDGTGDDNLYVRGTLTAVGTETQPITFTKKDGLEYGNEILVTHYLRGSITLKHCIMDGLHRGIGIISPSTVESSKILLENCTVRNCRHSMHLAGRDVKLKDCTLTGNGLNTEGGDAINSITIEGCTITGGPDSGAGVHLQPAQSVVLKNCLITGFSHSGVNVIKNPYNMLGGAPLIENCTIAGNEYGIVIDGISSPYDCYGPVIRNCIIAGNTDLDLANKAYNTYISYYATLEEGSIAYSLIGDDGADLPFSQSSYEHPDLGTIREIAADAYSHRVVGDPLFADNYHLKSAAGRWNGSTWVADAVTSPCIDAGDPASAYAREPAPNGGRINLGCYGNTALASKTPDDTAPPLSYTITATAGTNGTITPAGAVTVGHGESRQFTITPRDGYAIAEVKVDGVSVGALASYTFSDVAANHTIAASFRLISAGEPPADPYVPAAAIVSGNQEITVDLTKGSTILSAKQMAALLLLNEAKPVVLYGDGYSVTFPKGALQQGAEGQDYDFGLRFNEGLHYRTIHTLAGQDFFLMLEFNHDGALPGAAEISIYAGKEHAGKKLHYFYYNPADGQLEYVQAATVDGQGYVTVKQSRCSSYLLALDEKKGEGALPQTGVTGTLLRWLLLALIGAGLIVFTVNKKKLFPLQ